MPEPGISIFTPSASPPSNPSPAVPQARSSPAGDARVADGTRSDPSITPAQARWKTDYDELTRQDDWRRTDITIFKDADGNIRTRPRTGNGDGQPNAAPGAGEQPRGLVPQATVDGEVLRIGSYELSQADIARLFEARGLEESRKATVPASAEGYKFELSPDFKMPDGTEFAFAHGDPVSGPLLEQARQVAASAGMSQESFSKMLSLYAASQVQEKQVIARAQAAELAKLGALAPVRVDALTTFLRGAIGDEHAKQISNNLWTERQVVALERLMEKYVNGGVGGGSPGAHRDGGHRENRLSDSDYQKLSMHERIEYAKRFDQRQFQNGG